MKFMMFVATDTAPDTSPEPATDIGEWSDDVDGCGNGVSGDRLRPVAAAVTVRVRSADLLVTDGPFIETKE